ncbi:Uma2 family endonuclease [Streptomyces sp. NPDC006733]|uniref:Uma2 family endonuclease n=1 Tax=Streptomyces sp. NPDC006733 TaxID=3155460 RepID=UPI0033C6A1BB
MSALNVEPGEYRWDGLVRIWEETDVPEGCTAQIIEGIITVTPPPSKAHNIIAAKVQRPLYGVIPDDVGIYQRLGVAIPSRQSLCVPDLVIAPVSALRTPGYFIPADEAHLVAEITSPGTASPDRTGKPAAYACAGVPLYLLIDGWAPGGPTVTLFAEPQGIYYRCHRAVKFGDPVTLPEPFGITLDTRTYPVC